jgi:uncharacterized membrane protein YfcA
MEIFLPIADVTVNIFLLLVIAFVAGYLSSAFGISAGFFVTPILIIIGIPSDVAASRITGPMAASSVSSVMRTGVVPLWILRCSPSC